VLLIENDWLLFTVKRRRKSGVYTRQVWPLLILKMWSLLTISRISQCSLKKICQTRRTYSFAASVYTMVECALGFCYWFASSHGCEAIFTVVDRLTKTVVLIPTTTDCDAHESARLLFHVFSMRVVPADLVSMRDTRYTSH
jgi:hypothetical protein